MPVFHLPKPGHHICLTGLQWGDEGKGKITDNLSLTVDAVVRFQGGANAGHTIHIQGKKHVLHHLPTGVLQDDVLAVLGNGMVIEPKEFMEEYNLLPPEAQESVRISDRAHLVLPKHLETDRSREDNPTGTKIGTTLRGIGPTYEAKYARFGVRACELLREDNQELLDLPHFSEFYDAVKDKIVDTVPLLRDLDHNDQKILFEGAQGVLLDIDFGQYPFVTSSHCTPLGMGPGTGFSPRKIGRVVGVAKCYTTRVGTGPFPSKASAIEDEWLRERGSEFGATTGRPRICGWLDIPALKYAVEIGDVDEIALVKLDILNGLKKVPVCVGYTHNGKLLNEYPSDTQVLQEVEPVFEDWPGWEDASNYEQIRPFLENIQDKVGVPITMVGFGPDRADLLFLEDHPACSGPCCMPDPYISGLEGGGI